MGFRKLRPERDEAVEACNGLVDAVQGDERKDAVGAGVQKIGLEGKRLIVAFHGLRRQAEQVEHFAAVAMSQRGARIERDRPVEARHRPVELPQARKHVAPVDVDLGLAWIERNGPLVALQRFARAVHSLENEAHVGQGGHRIRFEPQRRAEQAMGQIETAKLIVCQRAQMQNVEVFALLAADFGVQALRLALVFRICAILEPAAIAHFLS